MSFIDYYKVLGVSPDANEEEIKEAYRRLVKVYHPDINKASEATQHFIEVQRAYEFLIDPIQRKEYDDKNSKDSRKTSKSASGTVTTERHYTFPTFRTNASVTVDLGEMVYALSSEDANVLYQQGSLRGTASETRDRNNYCHRCCHQWEKLPSHVSSQPSQLPEACPNCRAIDWTEFLLLRCLHCSAVFESEGDIREKVVESNKGKLFSPYDIFPRCPYCKRSRWCLSEEERLNSQHEEAQEAKHTHSEQPRRTTNTQSRRHRRNYQQAGRLITIGLVVASFVALYSLGWGITWYINPARGSKAVPATAITMPSTAVTGADCPAGGTARPAIMAPLVSGNHQNIVYVENKGTSDAPASGTLKRYDVTSHQTAEIVKLDNTLISDAQTSADGQWAFFTARTNGQAAFQLIRVDGQGLRTLYCTSASNLLNAVWSPNHNWIAFSLSDYPNPSPVTVPTVLLLNTTDGSIQTVLTGQSGISKFLLARIDNNKHIYIKATNTSAALYPETLTMVDANRHEQDLATLFSQNTPESPEPKSLISACWDYTTNPSQSELFISECTLTRYFPMSSNNIVQQAPSRISIRPATGGTPHTIYSSSTMAINAIQAISDNSLLLYVNNYSNVPEHLVDTSENGLWKINVDGSGLTQLTHETTENLSFVSISPQSPWSYISQDNKLYTYTHLSAHNNGKAINCSLYFGSLDNDTPILFASTDIANSTWGRPQYLYVAGWMTM